MPKGGSGGRVGGGVGYATGRRKYLTKKHATSFAFFNP